MFVRAWAGRSPEEFAHTVGGAIIAYLIAVAIAPYVGTSARLEPFSFFALILVTIGVTWLLDKVGIGTKIPGKWEYVVIVGLSVAIYNAIATQSTVPLATLPPIPTPQDPMAIVRGFLIGAAGGFVSTLFSGLKFHGRFNSTCRFT